MNYKLLDLCEQKYVGIKTVINFENHDEINFSQLHDQVMTADIKHINPKEAVMAIDTDFTKESFSYTPLVAVDDFTGNEGFTQFTRKPGLYYAFEVSAEECGPEWFGRLFEYVAEVGLELERTGYDLEYYDYSYKTRPLEDIEASKKMLSILLKKK